MGTTGREIDDRAETGTPWAGLLACFGLGVGAAALGLLPWMVAGLRLPLQNLWAEEVLPADMPVALLPLSQYYPTVVLALLVTGSGVAGLLARALHGRRPRHGVLAVGAGTLVVHLVAAVQSTTAVQAGLAERPAATLYLAALVAVVVVSVLAGLLVLRLTTARSRSVAVLGVSLLGLVLGTWFAVLVVPLGTVGSDSVVQVAVAVGRWTPSVVVGAAIAWGGLAARRRVVAAVASLLALWVVPALVAAVTLPAQARVLLPYPAELVADGLRILRTDLLQPGIALPPVLVAVVVAAVGLLVRREVVRRRVDGDQVDGDQVDRRGVADRA